MAVELYDEHEQSERVRNWLRDNGVSIFMGIALALTGIFGWRQWQDYKVERAQLANEYYTAIQAELEAENLQAALEQYAAMREGVGKHAYVALAGMLVASASAEAGRLDEAGEIFAELSQRNNLGAFEPLINLRHAQLLLAHSEAEQALAILNQAPPVGFEGIWLETRGDALLDSGRMEQAAEAYAEAVTQLRGAGRQFQQAQTKLDAVRSRIGLTEAS